MAEQRRQFPARQKLIHYPAARRSAKQDQGSGVANQCIRLPTTFIRLAVTSVCYGSLGIEATGVPNRIAPGPFPS